MVPIDLDRVREDARRASTDHLLDRVVVHRDTLTTEEIEVIEAELRERGVGADEIAFHGQWCSRAHSKFWDSPLWQAGGAPIWCSFCERPAQVRAWGWERLPGNLPFFPRVFYHCEQHPVSAVPPLFSTLHFPPRLKRGAKRLALGLSVLTVVVVATWWGVRSRYAHVADRELQALIAELDDVDPGWRLEDLEAARAAVPDHENSAVVIVVADRLIPPDWPTPPPAERQDGPFPWRRIPVQRPPLDARVSECPPDVRLDADLLRELSFEMARVPDAVETARRLATMSRGRHAIVYNPNFIATLLRDQLKARVIARLLCLDATLQAEKGDVDGGLTSCRAAVNCGRSLGDEPLLISMLIRGACVLATHDTLERTLAQGTPSELALRQTQELLADEDRQDLLLNAVRGDRAGMHQLAEHLEAGGMNFDEASRERRSDVALFLVGPGFLKKNHYWLLKWMTELVEIVRTEKEPDEAVANFEARMRQIHSERPPEALAASFLIPSLSRALEADHRRHAMLRCAVTALAAERYRLRHQRWPDSLEELVDDGLLATVPRDPFNGEPLSFLSTERNVFVSSIGPKPDDNDGNVRNGTVHHFQLWSLAERRKQSNTER